MTTRLTTREKDADSDFLLFLDMHFLLSSRRSYAGGERRRLSVGMAIIGGLPQAGTRLGSVLHWAGVNSFFASLESLSYVATLVAFVFLVCVHVSVEYFLVDCLYLDSNRFFDSIERSSNPLVASMKMRWVVVLQKFKDAPFAFRKHNYMEVLLCDEPTSGLDSAAASNMVVRFSDCR